MTENQLFDALVSMTFLCYGGYLGFYELFILWRGAMRYLLASAGTIQQYRYGQEPRDVLLLLQEQCIMSDIKVFQYEWGSVFSE
jgi:hypothetical protein